MAAVNSTDLSLKDVNRKGVIGEHTVVTREEEVFQLHGTEKFGSRSVTM